jgi:tetratricopeptide (TPR) repeat protein
VNADSPRIEDLRRRVQQDPTSIAFAQLAEECRRAGEYQEAVDVCQAGLAMHPGYASARVTLGRALLQLNRLDDAKAELGRVLAAAPDNLSAIRGLAQIHERQGSLAEALVHYQAALSRAPNDPELEQTIARLSRDLAGVSSARDKAQRTVAALEQWLHALHAARADRRA